MRNGVLISCATAALLLSNSFAFVGPATITVDDTNTTGVILRGSDSLNITSSGTVLLDTSSRTNKAVDSNSNGSITNSGFINVEKGSSAYGIYQTQKANHIVNSGTIKVKGNGGSYGINLYYIYDSYARVENSGTITVSDENAKATGIHVGNYGGNNDTIINSGTITVSGTGEHGSISGIVSFGDDTTITNSGTITVSSENGFDIGIFSMGNNVNIINDGTISANVAFESNNPVNIYNNNGALVDTSAIVAQKSLLINSGTIKLHNSNSVDKPAVTLKTFTQTASGVLQVDAQIHSDGTATNPTVSADNVNIEDGSKIDVNVISDSDAITKAFADNNGTVKNVIVSSNDINASIDKLKITDNSPILDFEAFLDNGNKVLNLKVLKTETSKINPEATPFVVTSASLAVLQGLGVFNGIVQSRQNSTRGLGSGDEAFKDRYMWVKPFGMYTKQDDKDGIYGFDAHTYGVGLGMDGEYKPGFRAGLAFFYSGVSVDTNHIDQSDDIDTYSIAAYGSNPVIDDRSMLFYQIGFGIQKNSSKRYITAINQTATADYTSKSFYIQAKAIRDYFVNDKLTVTPSIKGAIRYFKSPSYSESGAGAYNLNVSKFSTTQSILGISTDLRYKISDKTRFTTNLALDYDFKNDAQSVDFSFQGFDALVYNAKGIKNSALGYRFGIGISNIMKKNLMFDLGYSLNGRGSDFINHAITAKFKWKF